MKFWGYFSELAEKEKKEKTFMELDPYYLYPGQFRMTAPSAKTKKDDLKMSPSLKHQYLSNVPLNIRAKNPALTYTHLIFKQQE